jgi:hypothetical protein
LIDIKLVSFSKIRKEENQALTSSSTTMITTLTLGTTTMAATIVCALNSYQERGDDV